MILVESLKSICKRINKIDILQLFKVVVLLFVGAMTGFLLGLAHASFLYGADPAVLVLQNWFIGDSLDNPVPIDLEGRLMTFDTWHIPITGACIGTCFTAILLWALSQRK